MKRKNRIILLLTGIFYLLLIIIGVLFGIHTPDIKKIDFVINDTLAFGNGKKAKVILLGGQSNAAGCSLEEYLQKNVSNEEYEQYKRGYDNIYINYYVSGNNDSKGFVKMSTNQGENELYFGPEVGLAAELNERYPDELFFIIKFAWSGTNLFEEWLSPSSEGKTGYLYNNFVRYVENNMNYLTFKGYDVDIEGMCWMQGESDSFSIKNATEYEVHLLNFIKDIRKAFSKYSSSDGIAFVDAYIANNPVYWVYCDLVNESKRKVAEVSNMNTVIDTNAYNLRCDEEPQGYPDLAHYDSRSQIKLGNLFAEKIAGFF